MRFVLILFFGVFCALNAFCGEIVKVAFLATDLRNPANAAIFNGLGDALKEMQSKYSCVFEVEYLSADNSPQKQPAQLTNAFFGGFKAAVILPVFGADFSGGLSSLKGGNFAVASVGARISDSVSSISTDKRDIAAKVKRAMKRLSKNSKHYSLLCYFKYLGPEYGVDLKSEAEVSKLLYPWLGYGDFKNIVEGESVAKGVALDYYGPYAVKNAVEISRYDNFGEIFFSPWIIADMYPIKADADRLFAICIGSLPQIEIYLRNGQISCCVYDDYYGWGYYAARSIAEQLFSKARPKAEHRLIPALEADSSNLKSFVDDWRKWIK